MRLISQDGSISIDFDRNTFRLYERSIYLCFAPSRDQLIAIYNTAERAKEVFSEMHRKYSDEWLNMPGVNIYRMPRE